MDGREEAQGPSKDGSLENSFKICEFFQTKSSYERMSVTITLVMTNHLVDHRLEHHHKTVEWIQK